MTPESQSSEEILGNDDNCTVGSSTSQDKIYLKDISELVRKDAEASSNTPVKRKMPSWMLSNSNQNKSTSKKRKDSSDNQEPESSISPSTSHQQEKCDSPAQVHVDTGNVGASASNGIEANEGEELDGGVNVENGENKTAAVSGDADGNEAEEVDSKADIPKTSSESDVTASTSNGPSLPPVTIKTEKIDEDDVAVGHITPTSTKDIKPAVKVEKGEATSSTTRPTCKFGIKCYRQNPLHRREEAHPGDKDYQRPNFPAPPDGTPDCPYGDACYRRNPVHFRQYTHPPSTDFAQNWKLHKMRLRERKPNSTNPNSSYSDLDDDDDDYDLNDPFIDDHSTEEFVPGDDDEDEDD